MPIKTEMWRIDNGLQKVEFSSIETEQRLEEILEQDVTIIDSNLMVIGRQVPTGYGKYIDLLTIDLEGHLSIVELKRDKTPRDVVAQVLDYATWIQSLSYGDVVEIFSKYDTSKEFETAFEERFGTIPPEEINEEHQMLIVAAELDSSSERIVNYLSANYGVPINVIFFRYFKEGSSEYLSRSWLIDPAEVEAKSEQLGRKRSKEPWNGRDFYVSFGEGDYRSWEDARKYGFVSAGGGKWYSGTLSLLTPGARVFVCIPKVGYVGVGEVVDTAAAADEFTVEVDGEKMPILEAPTKAPELDHHIGNPEQCEYFVRVDWIKAIPSSEAIWEKGMFANQNSACKLRNKFTIERLTEHFNLDKEVEKQEVAIEFPLSIRASHKGKTYVGELVDMNGTIKFEGKEYSTPTTAAKVIVTDWKEVNGWDFWRYLNAESGKWEKIGKLR